MLPSQADNPRLSGSVVKQRIDMDQQRIRTLLHCPIECVVYLRLGAGIYDDDFDPDAAAGGDEVFCIGGIWILGIDQDGNDRRSGVQQLEELDALRSKLAIDERDPGDVA